MSNSSYFDSYSGGRDGLICAWDLGLDLETNTYDNEDPFTSPEDAPSRASKKARPSSFGKQVQAHTHWVNDILLAHSNSALVSASSDITVKVWRPHSEDNQIPETIGLHSDYVKCLASPGAHSNWVASGGLDHKIKLWDLNGGGEKLQIDLGENEVKGSVYALSVKGSVMASGGPEGIVRLWDPKSGKRITNFVGHTDNIRDILINQDGDTVMTASSDQSIKVWSVTAGRCMYTLTMHNDSVWSLYSDHPQLSLFYSSDRSGLVAKTDVRDCPDMDEGLSLAVAQEHDGVAKVVVAGDYFWTATSSSSINRWRDVNTRMEVQTPESVRPQRGYSIVSRPKLSSPLPREAPTVNGVTKSKIPLSCVLRISSNAAYPGQRPRDIEVSTIYSGTSARKMSEAIVDQDLGFIVPFHDLPEETIEGQNGLIKHVMLNDRRRVLTLDTAGEVTMWDLLRCVPIKSFGKRHLEEVMPEVNTTESVANWCGVDTRTGRLACILEENYCFDAEMYADELDVENDGEFRDDQRINLGKWVLRFLFSRLITEEIERDTKFRQDLMEKASTPTNLHRENAPSSIKLPIIPPPKFISEEDSMITPRPKNVTDGITHPPNTPGLTIGAATPHINGVTNTSGPNRPATAEDGTALEKRTSQQSQSRSSSDHTSDYFTSNTQAKSPVDGQSKDAVALGDTALEAATSSPVDADKEEKSGSLFGKKFRMNFPKKLGRTSQDVKPAVVDEKSEESDKSEEKEDRTIHDNFFGTIQKIRYDYEESIERGPSQHLASGIIPSSLSETPLLQLPPFTTVIIQEDRPDSGGVADLYRGTISSVGTDADLIERTGPMWLGDLLLKVCCDVRTMFENLITIIESHACQRSSQGFVRAATVPRPASQHRKYGWVRLLYLLKIRLHA